MNFINSILLFFAFLLLGSSISNVEFSINQQKLIFSPSTNDPYKDMVLVRGGTFAMGMDEESVMGDWNNTLRRVTVSAFRIDQYEVSNKKYRDYTIWLKEVYKPLGKDSLYKASLPDTLVWKTDLSYNEPMIEGYFRYKAFDNYPVVGVSWEQAIAYCRWRTDRANEPALKANGLINPKTPYLGKYEIDFETADSTRKVALLNKKKVKDLDDFVLIPDFRLPTEAEWEYVSKINLQNNVNPSGFVGKNGPNSKYKNADVQELDEPFPWASAGNESIRFYGKSKGKVKENVVVGMYKANFKNGTGDYMGMSGNPNDGAALPSRVNSFNQSPLNIFNIRGNVNEWVLDLYRPMSNIDMDDFNPYRGNIFKDGDDSLTSFYQTGVNTLISNKSRVYKGGSWADRAYWLSPGNRRFLDEDKGSAMIGFRCAMDRVGSSRPNSKKGNK
jgi:formylglycine-generating enzyme required for sulfatase activity